MHDFDERVRERTALLRAKCDALQLHRTGDDRVTTDTASGITDIPAGTLKRWRAAGEGPPTIVIGGRVFYGLDDLAQYIELSRGVHCVSSRRTKDHEGAPRSGVRKRARTG